MNIIEWFKNLKNKFIKSQEDIEFEQENFLPIRRDKIDFRDSDDRAQYIRSCCEQMLDATNEIDKATMEYRLITDYLVDIEEIERAPYESKKEAIKIAEQIITLKKDSDDSSKSIGKISEEDYRHLSRYAAEIKKDLEQMQENEDYKALVRTDLRTLESEKAITEYRIGELEASINNIKNMTAITVVAVILLIIMLTFLQLGLELNAVSGYIACAALGAIAMTWEFTSFKNASTRLKGSRRYLNKVIEKQNKVKIRYVNITNLLEYEYGKYHVKSSTDLEYLYEKYDEEKKAREFLGKAQDELSRKKRELLDALSGIRLKDPQIWTRQAQALADRKEMVEIRHELRIRRETLRATIEYNSRHRDDAKEEINALVREYPEYGKEILDIVSEFE
ncbi:MAG: hypothetical protein K6F99_06745 [Lachnospiraceae bacterium]|nr:hypothetical protein [Lachnospiraceae bacterium]